MILGDNIFLKQDFSQDIKDFTNGGLIFAHQVKDPQRYGVVEFDKEGQVISLEEKPTQPKSDFAVVGLYVFDKQVTSAVKNLQLSSRGELEIIDLQKYYLEKGELKAKIFDGLWEDAGTFDSLLRVSNEVARDAQLTGVGNMIKSI